jgi:CRP/FNR family transcriptional regulator, transcriptional activator FtrB
VLFEPGQLPTFQLIVLSGSVQLFGCASGGREVLIETVGPPDLVIPAAVMADEPYLMRARVPEVSRLFMIEASCLRAAVLKDPLLARHIIASLAGQFRRMVRQIKNLKLRTTTERVGCYILALSRSQDSRSRIVLPYEKNLIASELGMTRESFSRALGALQSEGIEVRGDEIRIRDLSRLAKACSPDPLIDPAENMRALAGWFQRGRSLPRDVEWKRSDSDTEFPQIGGAGNQGRQRPLGCFVPSKSWISPASDA